MDTIVPDNLVDYHSHLDLFPNFPSILLECERRGVYTLAVTTTPRAWPRNRDLSLKTQYVRAGLGLHPQLVAEFASEIQLWESFLSQTRYVGEVGLDASPSFYKSFELQKQVFERIVKLCSESRDKILSIHSVRTAKTVLDILEKYEMPIRGNVILHWFTGSKSEAKRAIELGCYFSINAQMLKNARHKATIELLPLDRLLTETDGPFCQNNGHPMKPWETSIVLDLLSHAKGISLTELSKRVLANLRSLEKL